MPSFDVVSEVNQHELTNAVDQTNREIKQRFDLKDSGAAVSHEKDKITIAASDQFQVEQVEKILNTRLVARKIDIGVLKDSVSETALGSARKIFTVQEGIDTPNGKKINQLIKSARIKAQSSIMDGKVRVTAKKIDDLRSIMDLIKEEKLDMPVQFNNFRD